MNDSYSLAKEYLNNPGRLEQLLAQERSELRELLFLQSEKAEEIQQKSSELTKAVATIEKACASLEKCQSLDTSLLETSSFSLNIAKSTSALLEKLCYVPIRVTELQNELQQGGFTLIQKELKNLGSDISIILEKVQNYLDSDEINSLYVDEANLMQIQTRMKSYFKLFNQFQLEMDEWLFKTAPEEALAQIAQGYDAFVKDYFEILLQEELISPGCLESKQIWYEICDEVITGIDKYFTEFAVETLDLGTLIGVLREYFTLINEIGSYLDQPPSKTVLRTYGVDQYTANFNVEVHDFFPIRREYCIGIYQYLLTLLRQYIKYTYSNSELSIAFIMKIFSFIREYEVLLDEAGLNVYLFKHPILLKMQQLEIDEELSKPPVKPFEIILEESTGQKRLDELTFSYNSFAKPSSSSEILLPFAEKVFKNTLQEYWSKTTTAEKMQVFDLISYSGDASDINEIFYVKAFELQYATETLIENFESSLQVKFSGLCTGAIQDYINNVKICINKKTNLAQDFNTIFQSNALITQFNHPDAGKLSLAIIKEASNVIVDFCTTIYKSIDVSLPYMNYQCFQNKTGWQNYFLFSKQCKNQAYAEILTKHAPIQSTDFQFLQEEPEIVHEANPYDNIGENKLCVVANDAFSLFEVVRKLQGDMDPKLRLSVDICQESEEYVQMATNACLKLISIACARISYLQLVQLPLEQLGSLEPPQSFWYQYRKSVQQFISNCNSQLEVYCERELAEQFFSSVYAFQYVSFLFAQEAEKTLALFSKEATAIDAMFVELKVKQTAIKKQQSLNNMFTQKQANGQCGFLEICCLLSKTNQNIDDFIKDNIRTFQEEGNFYEDLTPVAWAVKKYSEG